MRTWNPNLFPITKWPERTATRARDRASQRRERFGENEEKESAACFIHTLLVMMIGPEGEAQQILSRRKIGGRAFVLGREIEKARCA